ncbi:FAD-dependent oxidoreductase [Sedimentitalea sp. JM2-8]|uniref:FAD-dependent oxidoreductase n=1 Tax=Sedimentitalea xiamensis TaxID=3050037 RepID=A0ABT7FH98_9RHOB|nr:FAD-dependent oxidoreductase [Sedimentitalea xiamensis]MDK3074159.1 FAD-dependent oxidoreductase [Sedimentitalea xiamensis]
MKKVAIVGAGVAGMSAALRLLERGFHVTLYEQDDFVGGMLHSYRDKVTGTRREHSYHMFPNFYFNFWKIAEEIGIKNNFTPREAFRFLRGDELDRLPAMFNPSGPQDFLRNMDSGAAPPPDLFIYMYSMIDMLAEPEHKHDLLDTYSVNGFLHSRPYMTRIAADLHQTLWETVWAISSYQASAKSYRTFVKYTNRYSVPEFFLLAGNKWDYLMKPWLDKLESFDRFELKPLHRLAKVVPDKDGKRIARLEFDIVNRSPSVNDSWDVEDKCAVDVGNDAVVMAVTPGAIKRLLRDEFYDAAPHLGEVQYLEAEPMGALQFYLKCHIDKLPKDVTDFEGAKYYMTFLDYTQLWRDIGEHTAPGEKPDTFLYVTCSDVVSLLSIPPEKRHPEGHKKEHQLILDLDHPTTAIEYVLNEVMQHLPVDLDDIDLRKTAFDMNTGEELFANMVGSWERRPDTETPLENLWMAGTYVKNIMDVSTIEGAVISGLNAAECIRARHAKKSDPVTVLEPEAFPVELFQALKLAWAPLAASAKMWSEANTVMGRYGSSWDETQRKIIKAGVKALEPFMGRKPNPPHYLGPINWTNSVRNLPRDHPLAIGPIYWNYDENGFRKHGGGHHKKKHGVKLQSGSEHDKG